LPPKQITVRIQKTTADSTRSFDGHEKDHSGPHIVCALSLQAHRDRHATSFDVLPNRAADYLDSAGFPDHQRANRRAQPRLEALVQEKNSVMSELAEIRAELRELNRTAGRIEGTVNGMSKQLDAQAADHESLASRVGKLEHGQSYSAGATSVIGSIAGMVGGAIATWVGRHFAG
jgi:hypothetical protein